MRSPGPLSLRLKVNRAAEGVCLNNPKPLGGGRELAALARYAMWTGAAALLLLALFLAAAGK